MVTDVELNSTSTAPQGVQALENDVAAPAKTKILVVEDDAALGRFLSRELALKQFDVNLCRDGEEAFKEIQACAYDLVILDMNLPLMGGMDLLEYLHANKPHMPVVVVTARSTTEDLVKAFESGAHDYLIKPFSLLELLARVRTLLRRSTLPALPTVTAAPYLSVNKAERRILRGNRRIDLTPREFALLEHLMANAGKPVSRTTLMREVWNVPFDPSTNIVDVYMKYLRDKIDVEGEPKLIRTVRGVGYILSPE